MNAVLDIPLGQDEALLGQTHARLKGCPYFRTMDAELLRNMLRHGFYMEVPEGERVIREGELDDDIYFLLDGRLDVCSDNKRILTLDRTGDIIGEFAVVSSAPRSADVVAGSAARLVRLSSAVVKNSSADPTEAVQFLSVFTHIMAAKLRETSLRAKMYDDAVMRAQEMADSNLRLEGEMQDNLQEILLYSKLVEMGHDAVAITDVEGRVERVNPEARRLFGRLLKLGRLVGRDIGELRSAFHTGDFERHPQATPWKGEWIHDTHDEQWVFEVTVSPIMGKGGMAIAVAYQLHDVSRERAQEKAIALKNEEIRKALQDLEETYNELQRSDRLKMESLTVISNELTAPIRKILNHSTKLVDTFSRPLRPEVISQINAIQDQAVYLKAIGDNINHLIDLQSEPQSLVTAELDLAEVVDDVTQELLPKAERKRLDMRIDLPPQPLTLGGDPERFKVMLNLLLEQAVMVARQGSLVVLQAELMERSEQVHLDIRYSGPSLVNLPAGTGKEQNRMSLLIGLPLARKVVSQYQGSLQFMRHGEQSRISILLPRQQKEGKDRPNRILVLDESDLDRMIVRGVIEHQWPGSVILESEDPFEFLENYEDFRPDLVVVDPELAEPGWSNHRVIASLLQDRRHLCPVLTISQLYQDFAERTIAIERGVSDFLAKPYSIFDLQFKISNLIQSHRKEESLHQTMDLAQRQAFTDGLTKLANRKHFDGFLETQINYSRQTRKPCSLIMLDVDHFKHYNDTNGHQLGDEVLKGVAHILNGSVRSSDLPARYGGEEFAVVLPETKKEMAVVIAEKMRRAVADYDFPNRDKQPLGIVSASFGVATFAEDAEDAEGLLRAADECLYTAKEKSRNVVVSAPVRTEKAPHPPSPRQQQA